MKSSFVKLSHEIAHALCEPPSTMVIIVNFNYLQHFPLKGAVSIYHVHSTTYEFKRLGRIIIQ